MCGDFESRDRQSTRMPRRVGGWRVLHRAKSEALRARVGNPAVVPVTGTRGGLSRSGWKLRFGLGPDTPVPGAAAEFERRAAALTRGENRCDSGNPLCSTPPRALNVFGQALSRAENVANASTPGYVKQSATLVAMPFDLTGGATGGVSAGEVREGRAISSPTSRYDAIPRRWERRTRLVESLTSFRTFSAITDGSAISGAITDLNDAFSGAAVDPKQYHGAATSNQPGRRVAQAFHQAYASLTSIRDSVGQQIQSTVERSIESPPIWLN